jgi:hypothetical protein
MHAIGFHFSFTRKEQNIENVVSIVPVIKGPAVKGKCRSSNEGRDEFSYLKI